MLMASPRLRRTAAELNERLPNVEMPLDPVCARPQDAAGALPFSRPSGGCSGGLAARLNLQALVVTYGPGRFAEIAAARELGLPVIELQHGVIGPHCPDYAWPAQYRAAQSRTSRCRIASRCSDEVFRDLILRSGFWREAEILAVGAAAMESFRRGAPQGASFGRAAPPRVHDAGDEPAGGDPVLAGGRRDPPPSRPTGCGSPSRFIRKSSVRPASTAQS